VLNGSDHIRMFARRFDELIRLATVQPHGIGGVLDDLAATIRREQGGVPTIRP
jgi:hypothetical protein